MHCSAGDEACLEALYVCALPYIYIYNYIYVSVYIFAQEPENIQLTEWANGGGQGGQGDTKASEKKSSMGHAVMTVVNSTVGAAILGRNSTAWWC